MRAATLWAIGGTVSWDDERPILESAKLWHLQRLGLTSEIHSMYNALCARCLSYPALGTHHYTSSQSEFVDVSRASKAHLQLEFPLLSAEGA